MRNNDVTTVDLRVVPEPSGGAGEPTRRVQPGAVGPLVEELQGRLRALLALPLLPHERAHLEQAIEEIGAWRWGPEHFLAEAPGFVARIEKRLLELEKKGGG